MGLGGGGVWELSSCISNKPPGTEDHTLRRQVSTVALRADF